MKVEEITSKEEMLANLSLLQEVYPTLTKEDYSSELDSMLPYNYGQVGVYIGEECVGITGYWIGSKLWWEIFRIGQCSGFKEAPI